MEQNQQALAKIDGVIADIRMINLHLYNYFGHRLKQSDKEKLVQDFRKLNHAHFHEYAKRVSQYLKKTFRQINRTKLVISPVSFRFLKPKSKDEDFLRFENQNYGVKFIMTDLEREALLYVELYRRVRGGRVSGLALRKLQVSFLYELSQKYNEGLLYVEGLQQDAKHILEELTTIMAGELCQICKKHLSFSNESMSYLPPTVRETVQGGKQAKKSKHYYHEGCL